MMPDDENMCSIAVIRFYAIVGFKPSRSAGALDKWFIRKLVKASRKSEPDSGCEIIACNDFIIRMGFTQEETHHETLNGV